jgi:hypothetical protein
MKNRMKGDKIAYVLLVVLTVTDAWLISHPNVLGRLGVWFYKYQYISTFPKALLTVGLSVLAALGVVWWAGRLQPLVAKRVLGIGFGLATVFLLGVILKFSGGTYAHTGKAFIWGFYLLPVLLLIVFGNGLLELRRSR